MHLLFESKHLIVYQNVKLLTVSTPKHILISIIVKYAYSRFVNACSIKFFDLWWLFVDYTSLMNRID
jgi:hypothetical protein